MIEIEKKFILKDGDIDRLVEGASFLGEKTMTDSYYDDGNYSITRVDRWLRERNGKFELKLPLNDGKSVTTRELDQFDELDDEDKIRQALNLERNGTLAQDLERHGIRTFCTIVTTRKKYKRGPFTLDIDDMDFGYRVAEIELMVETKEEMKSALEKILKLALSFGLSPIPVRGKVLEYIFRFLPDHYSALVKSGVV